MADVVECGAVWLSLAARTEFAVYMENIDLNSKKLIPAIAALTVALIFAGMADLNIVGAQSAVDYDADDDGLIEITYLEQLNAISWDLDGDGVANNVANAEAYNAEFPGGPVWTGCPIGGCRGYELTRDLDFESPDSYARGEVHTPWREGSGWLPIVGVELGDIAFRAVFDGNNHTITNLYIGHSGHTDSGVSGLFGTSIGDIRRLGLVDVDVTGGTNTGALAGLNNGHITASFATGSVSGASDVGGLVGRNSGGVIGSYFSGSVSGASNVGGLVGNNSQGEIIDGHSNATIVGDGSVGGLAGRSDGAITASYSTGSLSGVFYKIGGLVGDNDGVIRASYTTSDVSGATASVGLGGLAGGNGGTISTSYAVGSVSGDSRVGGFVGINQGSVVASFWNTETSGQSMGIGEGANTGVEGKTTSEFQEPTDYGGMYAGWLTDLDNVDEDDDETTGKDDVWDFGSTTDYPALKMDIDGDGTATWWESGGQHARAIPTPTPTATLTATPTATPTITPTPTPSSTATPTASATMTPTPTNTLVFTVTPIPTAMATHTPLPADTPVPTATPEPTATPALPTHTPRVVVVGTSTPGPDAPAGGGCNSVGATPAGVDMGNLLFVVAVVGIIGCVKYCRKTFKQ